MAVYTQNYIYEVLEQYPLFWNMMLCSIIVQSMRQAVHTQRKNWDERRIPDKKALNICYFWEVCDKK